MGAEVVSFTSMTKAERQLYNWRAQARMWPREVVAELAAIHERYPEWITSYRAEASRPYRGRSGPEIPAGGCVAQLLEPPHDYAPFLVGADPKELLAQVAAEDKVRLSRGKAGTRRVMVWGLVRDSDEGTLTVRYGADGEWGLPGGEVSLGESPPGTCLRILTEMFGVAGLVAARLAAVDWTPRPGNGEPEAVHLVFEVWCDAKTFPEPDSATQWVRPGAFHGHLGKAWLHRVAMALDAAQDERMHFLVGGHPKLPMVEW